eukprot:scaffold474402_cov37-Prasinocladus_malaysianus.AAC.1
MAESAIALIHIKQHSCIFKPVIQLRADFAVVSLAACIKLAIGSKVPACCGHDHPCWPDVSQKVLPNSPTDSMESSQ